MDVLLTTYASYVTHDLVNRGGEPVKIALGLLKLTVLDQRPVRIAAHRCGRSPAISSTTVARCARPSTEPTGRPRSRARIRSRSIRVR